MRNATAGGHVASVELLAKGGKLGTMENNVAGEEGDVRAEVEVEKELACTDRSNGCEAGRSEFGCATTRAMQSGGLLRRRRRREVYMQGVHCDSC